MTYIYQTLSVLDIAHELRQDNDAGWSLNGAYALAEYITEYAESLGEPMQFDYVALRCDYSEYESLEDFNEQNGSEYKNLGELADKTAVIEFGGGIIVQTF